MSRVDPPSYPGYSASEDGSIVGPYGKVIRPSTDPKGYRVIGVYLGGGRRKRVKVHTIVCEAFHGPKPSPAHEVAHGDGDPANNHASNLRWATRRENAEDMRRHGVMPMGERHGNAKVTAAQVVQIRDRYSRGEQQTAIAEDYEIDHVSVWRIVHRKSWKHLP